MKTIGFPISHKENENRRAIIPIHIKFISNPEYLFFEKGYGNILGIGDVIMDGKYFCRGECVSNEALCFSLEVKILNDLIKKFPCIEKNYKQIEKEKRNAMVNRLKMIKFAKMNIMIGGLQNKFEKEIEQITQENSIELKKLRRKSIENKNKKRFFVSFYN